MSVSPVRTEIPPKTGLGSRLGLTLFAAFFAIYVVWGSTFFAIRVLVAEVPPLFAAGVRFATAGVVLYTISRWRGVPAPTWPEWRNLATLGALMFVLTYSALFWAEKTVPSGIAAVLVATLPIWTLLLETLVFRRAPLQAKTVGAIVIGFAGVAILTWNPGHYPFLACLAILGGETGWATGAVLSGSLRLPKSRAITAGAEMSLGGLMLLVCSVAAGELHTVPHFSMRASLAMIYLILFGSLFAFTAFVWLLSRMPATAVSSHAYVNPVVALALGHWFAGEVVSLRMLGGGLLILASVAVILRYRHVPE
jgi:drug/metabolite transporter (DMT)-like permease